MKKIFKQLKLQIPAAAANPAPPVGPALGSAGINIGEFVNRFNTETADRKGETVPVIITVYEDKSFDLTYKISPVSKMILASLGIEKGSGKNLVSKAGKLSKDQVKEIAEKKLPDLNANDTEAAMKIVEGTARSMGVETA